MAEEDGRITVAAAQMNVTGDHAKNKDKIIGCMSEASGRGVDVLVFPECALSGYPPVDIPSLDNLDPELIDGYLDEIRDSAARHRMWVCLGTAAFRKENWYNSALLISREGEIAAEYSKIHLCESDAVCFTQGNSLPVVSLEGIPVGMQICFDVRFPESWRVLKAKGAKVLLHLVNASEGDKWGMLWKLPIYNSTIRSRAAENAYFVVSANDSGPLQFAQSMIVDPEGMLLALANQEREEIISAELALNRVSDEWFKQRRTDLYELRYD